MLKHFFSTAMLHYGILITLVHFMPSVLAGCRSKQYTPHADGNCYAIIPYNDSVNAVEAGRLCAKDEAYLPTIRNAFDTALFRGFSVPLWPIALGYSKTPAGTWQWDNTPDYYKGYMNWAVGSPLPAGDHAYMNADGTWTNADVNVKTIVCQSRNSVSKCTPDKVTDAYYSWNSADDKCYYFTRSINNGASEAANQTAASSFCNARKGNLPRITSEAVNTYLAHLYQHQYISTIPAAGWIGLTLVDNQFVWNDGTVLDTFSDYMNFDVIDESVGNCVVMSYASTSLGRWRMAKCTDEYYLTCQRDLPTTPTPSTQGTSPMINPFSSTSTTPNVPITQVNTTAPTQKTKSTTTLALYVTLVLSFIVVL